jgi:enoyl-CoA hydratase
MDEVLVTERRGDVALVVLNRPERRNALNTPLLRAIEQALKAAQDDDRIEAIVLTGADPSFCAGVDMKELEETGRTPEMGDPLAGLEKPLIGAINGPAVTGGLELALMCDFLIASEQASFADTHARLGLLPGWGQMARLPHAVGTRRAAEMLLTGAPLTADRAQACGLVNEVVPHSALIPRALELAKSIAANDRGAVRVMLGQLREGAGMPITQTLETERLRASEWQGGGFDTTRLHEERSRLKAGEVGEVGG